MDDYLSAIDDVVAHGEGDTPSTVDAAHYYLDNASQPARVVLRDGRTPPRGGRPVNAIEVRFTAGFGSDGTVVPADLRQAILITVAHWFDHRGDASGASLPLAALELLDAQRVVRLA